MVGSLSELNKSQEFEGVIAGREEKGKNGKCLVGKLTDLEVAGPLWLISLKGEHAGTRACQGITRVSH